MLFGHKGDFIARYVVEEFEGYELKEDGILMYRRRVYVPNV
jgi:hypothetical protein